LERTFQGGRHLLSGEGSSTWSPSVECMGTGRCRSPVDLRSRTDSDRRSAGTIEIAIMKTRTTKNKAITRTKEDRETSPLMYETENDLRKEARVELIGIINQRLADAVDLQMQLKQAHWNVKGPHFIGLHELFDKIAEDVESYVDMIAERAVQLGGIAEG